MQNALHAAEVAAGGAGKEPPNVIALHKLEWDIKRLDIKVSCLESIFGELSPCAAPNAMTTTTDSSCTMRTEYNIFE